MKGRGVKFVLFLAIFALGVANIVVTLVNGGGVASVGFLFGGLLCALAVARIWLTFKGVG
jgi:hypothetical protein